MNPDSYARQYPPFPIVEDTPHNCGRHPCSSAHPLRYLLPHPRRRRQKPHGKARRKPSTCGSGASALQPDSRLVLLDAAFHSAYWLSDRIDTKLAPSSVVARPAVTFVIL
jgi:hypothetical protein